MIFFLFDLCVLLPRHLCHQSHARWYSSENLTETCNNIFFLKSLYSWHLIAILPSEESLSYQEVKLKVSPIIQ